MKKIMAEMTINVDVIHSPIWQIRRWLAFKVLTLGCVLLGCDFEIGEKIDDIIQDDPKIVGGGYVNDDFLKNFNKLAADFNLYIEQKHTSGSNRDSEIASDSDDYLESYEEKRADANDS